MELQRKFFLRETFKTLSAPADKEGRRTTTPGEAPMRRTIATVALALGVLGLTATAAQAHHGSITADCNGVTISWASFHGPSVISYTIDRSVEADTSGSFAISTPSGSRTIPLVSHGVQTLTASASWTTEGGGQIKPVTIPMNCGPAPVVTPAPAPAAPAPVTVAPQSGIGTGVVINRNVQRQSSRCINGFRRYDRNGHRLRDSQGRRIKVRCDRRTAGQRQGRRPGSPVRPNFTG